ncbi:MAG: CIA30 family protein [Winogradskyella sp.]|nr:CIA30 family protein [Winogradskyella sp.]
MPSFNTLIFAILMQTFTLFNFTPQSNLSNWRIIDDAVMGGRSDGYFQLNSEGYGEYTGEISLKNNGGFSSLHYYFDTLSTASYSKFILKIKGDGKRYQFRVKDKRSNSHSYIYKFESTKDWQTIEIPFSEMYASFRGRILDIPNFNGQQMEEIAFLIGNKKEESFKLLIDVISLK